MAQSEKSEQRKDVQGRNQADEEDGQKSQPQRLIGTIPAYIRDDEDDERDDDRSTRYPEPHAFLSEDAHLSEKYSKFLISGPNMREFALLVYHRLL